MSHSSSPHPDRPTESNATSLSEEAQAPASITIDIETIASSPSPMPTAVSTAAPRTPADMPPPPNFGPSPSFEPHPALQKENLVGVPLSPNQMPPPPPFPARQVEHTGPPLQQSPNPIPPPPPFPAPTQLQGEITTEPTVSSSPPQNSMPFSSQQAPLPPTMPLAFSSQQVPPSPAQQPAPSPVPQPPRHPSFSRPMPEAPPRQEPLPQAPTRSLPVHTHLPRSVQSAEPPQARLAVFIAPTPDELALVRQIIQLLHRAYQAFEFYPLNHPLVQQLSNQLFGVLRGFFRFREMLELRLERFRVLYTGQVIFEEQGLNNNVTYLLYSDGIRKLIIDASLTEDEYMRFFHVLHRSSTRRSVFEDTITLLWEQQLAHIRYFLVEDLTELYSPDMQALYNNMQQQPQAAALGPNTGSTQAVQIMQQLAGVRLQPSLEEKQALQRLIYEEERGLMRRFLEIVARVLEHEDEVLQLERLVRVLTQLQPILLSVGEIDHLALCLYYTSRLSNIFAQRNTEKSRQWHQTLQQILHESHSETVIQKLVALLDQNPHNESTKQDIERYIGWVEPPNPDTLLQGFAWAESVATRHFLCHVLARKYKEQARQVANGVLSDDPAIVRHTCMILAEIGHPAARPMLQKAAQHEDPDVRAEATRALLQCGGSTAVQPQMISLLRKNLGDDNPDVRRSALQGLPNLGQHALELLRGLYNNRLYEQWGEEDQRLLFDTTIRIGQRFHESLEFLVQALSKQYSGWLSGRKDLTSAKLAVQGLQRNGSPRAIAAIEQLYHSGSTPLRQVCEEAMQRLL